MAHRRFRRNPKNHSGTVYMLKIHLGDEVVYKVGVTVYSVARRVLQIIEGMYKVYGYFPEVHVVRQEKTKSHFKCETAIHNQLCDWQYVPLGAFTGSTELFKGMTEAELIERYELAINSDEDALLDERLAVW